MIKKSHIIFFLISSFILLSFNTNAQETNSSIGGSIKGSNNEPLVGATIVVTHIPTGTVYKIVSRAGGRYDITNMTPGGPYSLVVSFVGFKEEKREDVFLNLGEKARFDIALETNAGTLSEVVLSSRRASSQGKGGSETSIGRDKISTMPTVSRSMGDFLKYTPLAQFDASDGAISFAGQNNRYNAFFIDGAINNDVFGIASSGTNGGQANINPISIDAIDQFQVVVSPFDASIGGFTGGGINATTRSGTNILQGSAWYYFRNQNLAGKTPGNVSKSDRVKFAPFKNQTTGFRVGGPIIKNKLFYFLLGEIQRDERPQPFNLADYRGNMTLTDITNLSNFLKTNFGYDPGGFLDNPEEVIANRLTAKLDWNMNDQHRFSFSYRYNRGERYNVSASSSTVINFYNNGFIFPNQVHTATGELKSRFKKGASNRLLITYSNVLDDRDPLGQEFPRVTINDGSGRAVFGTEEFSTGNYLRQKNLTLNNSYKFYIGNNLLTIGTDNLYSNANNLFIRQLFGSYTYASLNDFLSNNRPTRYDRTFSKLEGKTDENNSESAAAFKYLNFSFFINDEIKANDNLTLNIGIRADKTEFLTNPKTDNFFNDTAISVISQYYDLRGARSGQISEVPWSISPRIGFTYKMPKENLTIRGGVGLFTGRMPLVWPGGVYNNNGVNLGSVGVNNPNITFRPDPFNQYGPQDFGVNLNNAKGQLDLISKEFKLPKVFRVSMAADKRFGNGWTFTSEAIFTKNINEIYYYNVNILPPALKSVGVGSRTVYSFSGTPSRINLRPSGVQNPYGGDIFLLVNNSGKKGFSYNLTFTLDKAFKDGWAANFNYALGNSIVVQEGTSSQNNSQFHRVQTINGNNFTGRSVSDFDLGHRFSGYLSKKFSYSGKKMNTTVTLVYNGQQGSPFSYVYTNSIVGDNGRTGGSEDNNSDLIYVPTQAELQTMIFDPVTVNGVLYDQATQGIFFEQYISASKYLSKRRGSFAERNADRLPFSHVIDLKIQQDFIFKLGKRDYTIQLSYDVYNFTNMISRKWGQTYFLSDDSYRLLTFTGFVSATDLTPKYQFRPQTGKPWSISTSSQPGVSARWISQLGVRVIF